MGHLYGYVLDMLQLMGSFMADVKLYSCYDVRIVLRGGIVGECVHK